MTTSFRPSARLTQHRLTALFLLTTGVALVAASCSNSPSNGVIGDGTGGQGTGGNGNSGGSAGGTPGGGGTSPGSGGTSGTSGGASGNSGGSTGAGGGTPGSGGAANVECDPSSAPAITRLGLETV